MLLNKLKFNAKKVDLFIKKYIKSQRKSLLITPMNYGVLSGGKKIRSSIIIATGKLYKVNSTQLLNICGAVECIHSYSLIHDDLPCMDNDNLRRGKLSTHKKFGESTAILAGNSLLTIAFEILCQKNFKLSDNIKIKLIKLLSECSGHSGVAGGQFLDLNFEKKKVPLKKIIEMQIKKTGKLFSFCCIVPIIIKKNFQLYKKFDEMGSKIGLLFQIADDLIDYKGQTKKAGKKTNKDKKIGKATLIGLLGYKNTIKYREKLKLNIFKSLDKFGNKASDLKNTIEYIIIRSK